MIGISSHFVCYDMCLAKTWGYVLIPSGKLSPNYGKIQKNAFFMGKSTTFRLGHGFHVAFCMFTRPGIHHVGEPFFRQARVGHGHLTGLCVPGIVPLRLPHMYNYNYNYI